MQYSGKDYEFLGKRVVAGHYVSRSTFFLTLILTFLIGIAIGRYLLPDMSGAMPGAEGQKRPLGEKSNIAAAVNPNKQLLDSILQHEEIELFKKALTIDPKHEFALFNSGIVLYHDLNRKEEAMEVWRALVKINPNAKAPSGELVSDMLEKH